MPKLDIFGDGRKTPHISVNVKVKIPTNNQVENVKWNKAFGYVMKKPRTKLEFLMVDAIRCLSLDKIELDDIKNYISEEDYTQLSTIKKIFNKKLTADVKAFILAMLRVQKSVLENIIKGKKDQETTK